MPDFDKDFMEVWNMIKEEHDKVDKKVDTMLKVIHDMEVIGYSSMGILMQGKLSSQQQIKFRKQFSQFVDTMLMWTDPRVNIKLSNKYNYARLKEKKLEELNHVED